MHATPDHSESGSADPSSDSPRGGRPLWLALLLLVLGGFVVADHEFKNGAATGLAPADTDWLIATRDVRAAWSAFENTPYFDAIRRQTGDPFAKGILDARKQFGIRLTPSRWDLWMGRGAVLAESEGEVGLCIRPGLLLRIRSLFHEAAADGIWQSKGISYAWADGYLVASKSPRYVRRSIDEHARTIEIAAVDPVLDKPSLHWEWRNGDRVIEGTTTIDATFSIRAEVEMKLEAQGTPLELTGLWPGGAIMSVSGATLGPLARVVRETLPEYPGSELLHEAFESLEEALPENWNDGAEEIALALLNVDTKEFLAVPEWAIVLRGDSMDEIPEAPAASIPFVWQGHQGWMMPWLGEKLSICVASDGVYRYITGNERSMARVIGKAPHADRMRADVWLRFDWDRLGRLTKVLVRRAAEYELIPRMNGADVERDWIPGLDRVSKLGTTTLRGVRRADGVRFEGSLSADTADERGES